MKATGRILAGLRPNKRTASTCSPLALLTPLYHSCSYFPPLHPSPKRTTAVFLPSSSSHTPPHTLDPYTLLDAALQRPIVALSANSSLAVVQPDEWSMRDYSSVNELVSYSHTLERAFHSGSEPVLRKRLRRVVDALHGTAAGGLVGVESVRERKDMAKEMKEGWDEDMVRVRAEEADRLQREEVEQKGFAEAFR